jgi:hypothetical protein
VHVGRHGDLFGPPGAYLGYFLSLAILPVTVPFGVIGAPSDYFSLGKVPGAGSEGKVDLCLGKGWRRKSRGLPRLVYTPVEGVEGVRARVEWGRLARTCACSDSWRVEHAFHASEMRLVQDENASPRLLARRLHVYTDEH